jgi:hypothetical protein
VAWTVLLRSDFEPEFRALPETVQDELVAIARMLEHFGPGLGRPRGDTLKGSRHSNMKELRFHSAGREWRVAFAFDPQRRALLLAAGSKSGVAASRFYRSLLRQADARFDEHLIDLSKSRR